MRGHCCSAPDCRSPIWERHHRFAPCLVAPAGPRSLHPRRLRGAVRTRRQDPGSWCDSIRRRRFHARVEDAAAVLDRPRAGEASRTRRLSVALGREVRVANACAGLNLIVWQIGILPEDLKRLDVTSAAMTAFIRLHGGFLLKEVIVQPETMEHLHGLRNAGGLLLNPADGSYGEFHVSEAHDFLTAPCNIGGTRERVLGQLVSWAFPLFVYQPPRCGFSRSEQRLLFSALDGGTDEELAKTLQVSVSAVKKMWHSIYERVGACVPELLPNSVNHVESGERGKEKKHRLLAYLREHPEELRPVARRLLHQMG